MIDETKARVLDRRGFLKGSALFAALAGISVAAPALAQEPQKPVPEGDRPADKTEQPPAPKRKPLLDKDGREYRVCDMCGGNMYKQENTWTCEQCGYSYQE
jgi:anaerobic selenocysteine-containing dehydrogenase